MLLPQVPGAIQQKVAARIGFDLKILSGSIGGERTTLENRVARLQVVEEFVRANEPVGKQSEFTSWNSDEADAMLVDLGSGAIMFVIPSGDQTTGLGGSARHLVGSMASDTSDIPFSFLPQMAAHLAGASEESPHLLLGLSEKQLRRYVAPGISQKFDAWVSVLEWTAQNSVVTPQRVTYLSKRLVSERNELIGKTYTLGSPLFVALAD